MIKYLQELSAYFRQICLTSHFNFTERVWRDVCKYVLHLILILQSVFGVMYANISYMLLQFFQELVW
jgi:hypothetical protein